MAKDSRGRARIITAVISASALVVAAIMSRPAGRGASRNSAGGPSSGHVGAEGARRVTGVAGDSIVATSPTELMRPLMTLPPVLRLAMVKNSLVGRTVRWQGTLEAILSVGDDFVVVTRETGSGGNVFRSRFAPEWKARLAGLAKGDSIAILGRIEQVQFNEASLSGIELRATGNARPR